MLLTLVTFLPLFGALLCLLIPREEEGLLNGFAFTVSLVTFCASPSATALRTSSSSAINRASERR